MTQNVNDESCNNFIESMPTDFNVQHEKLKQCILFCFENFEFESCNNDNTHCNVSYSEFYDLVYRITRFDRNPFCAYDIYHSCATEWFNLFANLLLQKLVALAPVASSECNQLDYLRPAQLLACFWKNIFNNVLNFIGSAYMYLERLNWKSSDQVLILEMTNLLFTELIIEKQPTISDYIFNVVRTCLELNYDKIEQYLIENKHENNVQLSSILSIENDCSIRVMIDLINMLIKLNKENLILFYKIIEIPLLEQNEKYAKNLANKQIGNSSTVEYMRFVSKFFSLSFQLIGLVGFPEKSQKNYSNLMAFYLLTLKVPEVIYNESNGFKVLLAANQLDQCAEIYSIINLFHQKTKQDMLIDLMTSFVQRYLAERLRSMTNKHQLKNRIQAILFVNELLDLHYQWDNIQQKVFFNQIKFETLVKQFYFDLNKINDRTPQSIAFYMHDLLLDTSENTCRQEFCENNQDKSSIIRQMLSNSSSLLVPYIKDINNFFDFTKYYFCIRQLLKSTKLIDLQNEFIDQLCLLIKYHFCNETIIQKNFTQSLQDFRLIVNDLSHSVDFHTISYLPSVMFNPFISEFSILHAGFWKLIDYENCYVPSKVLDSFFTFEQIYQEKFPRRKLLLNTKFCKVTLVVMMSDIQRQPIELITSMHQFAILTLFNNYKILSYEIIFQKTKFQKEHNLQIALISLLYIQLLICNPGKSKKSLHIKNCRFMLNENFFDELLHNANDSRNKISKDISDYEDLNYWNKSTMPLALSVMPSSKVTLRSLVDLISDDTDLFFNATQHVVDESIHDGIFQRAKNSEEGQNSTDSKQNTRRQSSLLAKAESKRCKTQNNSSLTQQSSANAANSSTVFGGSGQSKDPSTERMIKLEAAIVRVLKKAKQLPNIHIIYIQVIEAMRTSFPGDIHFEEVRQALMLLIDKKYVKRTSSGGFEFILD